jgi:hypothetical protein
MYYRLRSWTSRLFPVKPSLVSCEIGVMIPEKYYSIYHRLQLCPAELMPISLSQLQCEISLDFEEVTHPFFLKSDGSHNRSITSSPHYQLICIYQQKGLKWLKENFKQLDYYDFFMSFNQVGEKTNLFNPEQKHPVHFTTEQIWQKIERFIRLYEGLKKAGYVQGQYKGHYIAVLDTPLVVSRFGKKTAFKPYEIFSGHHRASCLAALEQERVEVLLLQDVGKQSLLKE